MIAVIYLLFRYRDGKTVIEARPENCVFLACKHKDVNYEKRCGCENKKEEKIVFWYLNILIFQWKEYGFCPCSLISVNKADLYTVFLILFQGSFSFLGSTS